MNVKIKGLVFVGFAAAVFAQNAMATPEQDALDRKTVTSKYYVDQKFQTKENIVTTTEAAANGFNWADETTYPSIALLNQVQTQVSGIDVNGDETYIHVADSNGTFTVSPLNTPATQSSELVGTVTNPTKFVTAGAVNGLIEAQGSSATSTIATIGAGSNGDKVVPTAKNVYTYAEATANKLPYNTTANNGAGAETITGAVAEAAATNTSNEKFPTVKNVYEFVKAENGNYQPKVVGSGPKVGVLSGTTGTWETIRASNGQTGTAASTNYLTMTHDSENHIYEINLISDQVATAGSAVASGGVKLATTGAVYDYAQPKVSTTNALQVGYSTGAGNATWKTLRGAATQGTQASTPYVTINEGADGSNQPNGVYTVNLNSAQIATHGVDDPNGSTYSNQIVANSEQLTTANAVYEYVNQVTGGLGIPPMSEACAQAINGTTGTDKHCALVASWIPASGTEAAHIGLEWTLMASVE